MMRSLSRRVAVAALLALTAWAGALATVARAQPPRAIVLRFDGPRADRARDAVVLALAPEVQLVTEEQAVATAANLGVDVSSPEGMATVIENLGIRLVVVGSVRGRGRRAETRITVIDPTGDELAQRSAPSPRRAADREAIGEAAIEAVREARAALERARAPEPEPQPEPRPSMMAPRPPEQRQEPEAGWAPKQLVVYAGVRIRTVGSYIVDDTDLLHFFTSDAYPEIDLELALRPWPEAPDALRGIFFGAQGSFSVGMAYVDSLGATHGMTSLRFRFDLGYAHVFGDVFELAGMLGFGIEGVQLDQVDTFPSTLFSFLRPGVAGRLRLVPDFLIVEAGIGGRIGLDGGPLAATYGPGLFFGGVDVFLGVAGTVEPGFSWAARIGYVHHALELSGMGGTFATGVSGTDETIEGRFLLGWSI